MKIPLYFFKPFEELGRAIGVAVLLYVIIAIQATGIPTTQEGFTALIAGALPIILAAIRTFLNKTPLTPTDPAAIEGFTIATRPPSSPSTTQPPPGGPATPPSTGG